MVEPTPLKDKGEVLNVSEKDLMHSFWHYTSNGFLYFYVVQAEGEDDKCELPGCKNKKRIEGTRVFDYCCRQHAVQDTPYREGIYDCNKHNISG